MSTVLTKPVLLDETGQAIVGKLQDIQQAIGGTGEFIPINIRVTTPPTKTNYLAGEALDLSGMVVTLVANNGGMYDVTGDCVFSPADGSVVTSSTTEVNISYTWYKDSTVFTAVQPISIKELASIAVTTPPTVTDYFAGEELDLTGIVVTASYADGSTSDVTNDCVFSPADGDVLTANDTTISITYTQGSIVKTATQELTITAIYGAQWDGTATTAWTRTDAAQNFTDPDPAINNGTGSSPFDDLMPWSGLQIVENAEVGSLVSIPKYWYKWTRTGSTMKLQISNGPVEGFLVSPAHADRGDGNGERDTVYVGRYHCDTNAFKSITGAYPKRSQTRATFRTSIHSLGTDIWQYDFAMYWTIMMLYLVEFADWDSQAKIGYGCGNNSSVEKAGLTDDMIYHTGTNAANRTTYGHVQYRHIEDLWANVTDWVDGIYFSGTTVYAIKNPTNFSDTTGGTNVGTRSAETETTCCAKAWNKPSATGFEWALYPSDVQRYSNWTTYTTDMCTYQSSGIALSVGGYVNQFQQYGAFAFDGTTSASTTSPGIGSRLMKLPVNT